MLLNKLVTIDQHILDMQKLHPEATGEFSNLLYDIALAAKIIGREVRRAGLVDILGLTGQENVQGEQVQKLDVYANEAMIRMNEFTGRVCLMASEEEDDIIPVSPDGRYVLIFDPLDGSSNIDYNARARARGGRLHRLWFQHHDGLLDRTRCLWLYP